MTALRRLLKVQRRLQALAARIPSIRLPDSALFWTLALIVPISTILSTRVWLRSAYSGGAFHLEGFVSQYAHGIYRYRVLGRFAVLFIFQHLQTVFRDRPFPMPRDPAATFLFYASIVILDALCFAVSNLLILYLFADERLRIADTRLAAYFYLTFVQVLAMAVVTPYDQLAYALMWVSLFAATRGKAWAAYPVLALAALAGTLTRETQFLVTPALFSAALFSGARSSARRWIAGCLNLAIFGAVYVALRVLYPGQQAIAAGPTGGGTWGLASGLALCLFFYVGTYLAGRIHSDLRPTVVLVALSVPYLAVILVSGVLRELRLLVPLLMVQAFLYVDLARLRPDSTAQAKCRPGAPLLY